MLPKRQKIDRVVIVMFLLILVGALTGTVIIVPDAGRTGECASQYSRTAPSFCRYQGIVNVALSSGVGCTAGTFNATHPVPSTATMVVVQLDQRFKSNNTANQVHIADARFFENVGCTTQRVAAISRTREFNAVAAGGDLDLNSIMLYVPPSGINTFHYTTTNTGGTHVYDLVVIGYYD